MLTLPPYINHRYGADNEGNTVIGPQRPNASVNPTPDTKGGSHSGYFSGNEIRGFSQIHFDIGSESDDIIKQKII